MQAVRNPPTSSSVRVRSSAAEAEPVGQAPRTVVDAGAAVHVEQVHRLQQFAAGTSQRLGHGIGRMPVLHHEGQIDVRGREPADRAADRDAARHLLLVEEHAEVDLEPADTPGCGRAARGAGQIEPCRDGGVDLPHGADGDLIETAGPRHEVRRAGRVQARQGRRAVTRRDEAHRSETERVRQHVPGGHRRTSVVVLAGEHRGEELALPRQFGPFGAARAAPLDHPRQARSRVREDDAHFEQAYVGLAPAGVVGQRTEETGQQGATQEGLLRVERVGHPHRRPGQIDIVMGAGRHEGVGPALRRTQAPQDVLDLTPGALQRGQTSGLGPRRDVPRHVGIAERARYLLDHVVNPVGLGPDIGTVGRHHDHQHALVNVPLLLQHSEADRLNEPGDLLGAQGHADLAVHPGDGH